jgi:hypothetical protein
MAKKIALGVLAVLALFVVVVLVLAAFKPDRIHIERSLVMRGTPAEVFPHANDLRKFIEWMPWAELDPEQVIEFSEPAAGVGAWYTWKGNDDVGQGRMEVLAADPNKVVHKLEFIEPFASVADTSLVFEAVGDDQVEVTWAYDANAGFGTKLMCVFMDLDKMLGPDFEKGLANLARALSAGSPGT